MSSKPKIVQMLARAAYAARGLPYTPEVDAAMAVEAVKVVRRWLNHNEFITERTYPDGVKCRNEFTITRESNGTWDADIKIFSPEGESFQRLEGGQWENDGFIQQRPKANALEQMKNWLDSSGAE